jgi:hypothetical protein
MAETVMPENDIYYEPSDTRMVWGPATTHEFNTGNLPPVFSPGGSRRAQQAFVEWMTERESHYGHVPFCGARPQFILDEQYRPVIADGYTALRWRASGHSMELGRTSWPTGWSVLTQLNAYDGFYYTSVEAEDYAVHAHSTVASSPREAMDNHHKSVKLLIDLANFHGHESTPNADTQVLLQPA